MAYNILIVAIHSQIDYMKLTKLNDMKYKLIKDYPLVKMPCMVQKLASGTYGQILGDQIINGFEPAEIENYPEFWQEVKEPLFVTEDGVEIYDNKEMVYYINCDEFFYVGWQYVCYIDSSKASPYMIFSTREAAEEWIKENKPRFSEKQVLDAISKLASFECTGVFIRLKKELGL